MRINEITEDRDSRDLNYLVEHCGPYLAEIGSLGQSFLPMRRLYRGLSRAMADDATFAVIDVHQHRQPRDTLLEVHNMIDDWFRATMPTHIRYRSASVFCTGSLRVAQTYCAGGGLNAVAAVLPIGDYHYCWSTMYADLYRKVLGVTKTKSAIEEVLNNGGYKEDSGLRDAMNRGHEIMIHCQKAVLIRYDRLQELYQELMRRAEARKPR